jgi:hypothetical protein
MQEKTDVWQIRQQILDLPSVRDMDPHERLSLVRQIKSKSLAELDRTLERYTH